MASTIILLYALDTGQIPRGCYIAAWTLLAFKFALSIFELKCKKRHKAVQRCKNEKSNTMDRRQKSAEK